MNGINENDCDKFFTIVDDNLDGHRRRATVREGVKEWIEDLHRKPRCSDFIHEFLELIAGEMLVVDPHNRIHCGELSERFSKMVLKAEENSNYLSEGKPHPPRTLVERETLSTALITNPPISSIIVSANLDWCTAVYSACQSFLS